MSEGTAPLSIVGYEEDRDLRFVTWNQKFLSTQAKEYELRHREAVVFCNVARSRVRIVAVFYGLPVLILPPIDPDDKISLYIKINQFLRQFGGTTRAIEFFDSEIKSARERLAEQVKRQELVAGAKKQRRSK